jgi:2-amino-4-deoxychorismate synthase
MLGHMAAKMGCEVTVVDTFDFDPANHNSDIVILGPGPGNINNEKDERMKKLLSHVDTLRRQNCPVLGICLGHQALAKQRGMSVVKRDFPTQGMQREIELYGKKERVGFYNSYVVKGDDPAVELSRDGEGVVTAMRRGNMIGYQFHPESVMSQHGYELLKKALCELTIPASKR